MNVGDRDRVTGSMAGTERQRGGAQDVAIKGARRMNVGDLSIHQCRTPKTHLNSKFWPFSSKKKQQQQGKKAQTRKRKKRELDGTNVSLYLS